MLMRDQEIVVVAASVDSVEETAELAAAQRVRFVKMLAELDGAATAKATGAFLQDGDSDYLHAAGFLLNPAGEVVNAVYSTGPIGRFTANDILKKVIFEKRRASR